MKKLDRFILKSFVGPFVAILLVVTFILMMQFLWLYIDELVGKGLSLAVIMEFLGWGAITTMPLSLPLATLLSSMMTMGTFGENNELLAIKAAGISLIRVLMPLMAASFAISIGAYFITNNLVPVAYNEIYTLRDDIGRTKSDIKIPSGTFYDGIDGYVLRVEEQSENSAMMYGVMVYDHSSNKGNVSLTVADSARMSLSGDKSYLSFELFNGVNYEEQNTRNFRDTTYDLQRVKFDNQMLYIPLENYAFEKSEGNRFSDEVNSMTVSQLLVQKDSLDKTRARQKAAHTKTLRREGGLAYMYQLDTSRHITKAYPEEELLVFESLDDEISACNRAIRSAGDYLSVLTSFGRDVYRDTFILRRTDVGILKKAATALACFIFFFIGAPIGAFIRKGGLGASAIISVLFFVVYWVIDISGTKLARDGAVSAISGVFISSYILAPVGAYLTWKAINDSPVINKEAVRNFFKKWFDKITGKMSRTRIVYMGTPDFAVAPLKALLDAGYHVVGVVTVADKPLGRGMKVGESAVKKFAKEHGLPLLQPLSLKDEEFINAYKAWKPDLAVVVAFRMLPKVVWEIPRLGTFNLHAALLPQYRGAAPINWALINGENMTGVTTFKIDEGMDTGYIMMRENCRIEPEDTAGTLHDKLMTIGSQLVLQTVEGLLDNDIEMRLQKSFIQGAEVLKPAPKLTRELCDINWNSSVEALYNLIRGLSPYPSAFTTFEKEDGSCVPVKIFFARKNFERHAQPGTILTDGKTYLSIACKDGALDVVELQSAGKKRMAVEDFLRGFHHPEQYKAVRKS
ncbi:MAG: methionyl-tRNA formyltransferase [Bacteroidales bacterium]|nr:methionyl-tRNA formyltransferase [Bacteroidales bacterium]